MKFNQNRKDGSCELEFSEEEIKTLNRNKKIYFTPEALKSVGNCLMKIVIDWNGNFDGELQKKLNTGEEAPLDLSKDGPSNK